MDMSPTVVGQRVEFLAARSRERDGTGLARQGSEILQEGNFLKPHGCLLRACAALLPQATGNLNSIAMGLGRGFSEEEPLVLHLSAVMLKTRESESVSQRC